MDVITKGAKNMVYTTRRLIAALMNKYDIETKYALAKLIGASQRSAANWVDHGTTFDDKTAYKVAQLLDIDYEYVLICMNLERAAANPRARKAWQHVAETWNQAKVAVITIVSTPLFVSIFTVSGDIS